MIFTRSLAAERWVAATLVVPWLIRTRYVYGSSGDFGPAFLAGVNVKTGEIAFQDHSFPKSNLLYVDGPLIILDEDGNLALATVSPEGLKVISKVALMRNIAWTAPTLVGSNFTCAIGAA